MKITVIESAGPFELTSQSETGNVYKTGDIIEKNYFWELHQDAYWVLGVLILAFLTSIGPWVCLQRIPLHRALADS